MMIKLMDRFAPVAVACHLLLAMKIDQETSCLSLKASPILTGRYVRDGTTRAFVEMFSPA